MTEAVIVRRAEAGDAERLTEVAHAAKAHWGYPPEWLELWRSSLTFDAALLERDWVLLAELDGLAMAVVAVEGTPPTLELSHLWVDPEAMGRGLGTRLFAAAVEHAGQCGARRLEIASDPHAEEFYTQNGASRVGDIESLPAGRRLPLLAIEL